MPQSVLNANLLSHGLHCLCSVGQLIKPVRCGLLELLFYFYNSTSFFSCCLNCKSVTHKYRLPSSGGWNIITLQYLEFMIVGSIFWQLF